jgi:hypothetical protein
MQVLLRKSAQRHDIECSVCKQGFRVYWERTSQTERDTMRAIVQGELREHHAIDPTSAAHPEAPFNLPAWSGAPQYSGAALLGGLTGLRRLATVRNDRS